jgi:hypothetical protein
MLGLMKALECRLCFRCEAGLSCPVEVENIHPEWGKSRILNLIAAWGNQLIEVLGDRRWTPELLISTWYMAETGEVPPGDIEYKIGDSGGGFDRIEFCFPPGRALLRTLPRRISRCRSNTRS